MSYEIDLGLAAGDRPGTMDLVELLATRLLVQGNSGSGKSHLLRRLLEQTAGLVQQAVIDPEGDFVTLAERFGHLVIDAAAHAGSGHARAAEQVREHRISVVLILEGARRRRADAPRRRLPGRLFEAAREHWFPCWWWWTRRSSSRPAAAAEASDEASRLSLGAMTNLMCRGRKRGLAGVVATQRLAKLAKNVAAEASNFLMGRTFLDIDMARAADLLGLERRQAEMFRDLPRGHFVALGPALSKRPLPIAVGPTLTGSRSVPLALLPLPEPSGEARTLILAAGPQQGEARSPRAERAKPRPAGQDVLVQLANYRPPVRADLPPGELESPADREAALDAILRSVLADTDAAACTPATLYQDFTVRCRIGRIGGEPPSLSEFKHRLAVARAGASDGLPVEAVAWERARAVAADLPEDLAGLYLLVARAAITRAPCPSDAALAQAYGTSSSARARRMLAFLEERGAIVVRRDLRGAPILAVPDLEAETAPGEPELAAAPRRRGRS